MSKKILLALVILVFTPCLAFAQKGPTIELEGRYWITDLKGKIKHTELVGAESTGFRRALKVVVPRTCKDIGTPPAPSKVTTVSVNSATARWAFLGLRASLGTSSGAYLWPLRKRLGRPWWDC